MTEFAISGPLFLAAFVALAAGTISFASPCVIPLVPGYLAYLAGLVGADTDSTRRSDRWRVAGAALLFVLGFVVVFGAAVISVLGVSDALLANEQLLQRIGGAVTIAMGLAFLGWIPALRKDLRFRPRRVSGLWGAPLLGAVFGLGWTPCLGPTLAGVIALASGTQAGPPVWRGVVLVLAYCFGLGLPFVLLALSARWAVTTAGWLRRNKRAVQETGGVLLIVVGVLLVTGLWGGLVPLLRGPISGFTTPL